ncbi:MAG TPA: type II secretion system protein [Gammaproteobacteria bacterium]|nr:type II secretion system protein [Gammaproteobacteria bacterium]
MRATARAAGFTLIELVITLVLSSIVVGFVSMFISGPVQGFMDQGRRVRLVDAADTALRRIARDVRIALPNSVRTTSSGGVVALELLATIDGARYRTQPPGGDPEILDFANPDDSFDAVAPFTQVAKPWSSTAYYLAIYNVGVPGADAYELSNVITPPGTQINIAAGVGGADRVTLGSPLGSPFRFAYDSPTHRVYLVEGPVTYLCNPLARTLTRYRGYTIDPSQSNRDSDAELMANGATRSLMADEIAGCAMAYTPGTAARAGLVTLQFTVGTGETVSLLSQVHVDNVP